MVNQVIKRKNARIRRKIRITENEKGRKKKTEARRS